MLLDHLDAGERFALEKPLRDLLRIFTYRPGWEFSVRDGYLCVVAPVIDATDPKLAQEMTITFRQPIPHYHIMREGGYLQDTRFWQEWLLRQIMTIERHEAQEFFKVDGVAVYDPHKND